MAAKFSLEKAAGGKRPSQENASPQQVTKKIPKVSQMQPAEPRPQRATTNAPGDCFVGASAGVGLTSSGKRHVIKGAGVRILVRLKHVIQIWDTTENNHKLLSASTPSPIALGTSGHNSRERANNCGRSKWTMTRGRPSA